MSWRVPPTSLITNEFSDANSFSLSSEMRAIFIDPIPIHAEKNDEKS